MSIVLAGEQARVFREKELAFYGAYWSGVFSQSYEKGRFPSYNKYAPTRDGKRRKPKPQNWQTQKAMARILNAALGGDFKKR